MSEWASDPILRKIVQKFNPKILAVIVDRREVKMHKAAILATTAPPLDQREWERPKVAYKIPWWFDNPDGKAVAEKLSEPTAPAQSSAVESDEQWYARQIVEQNSNPKEEQNMVNVVRSNQAQGTSTPKGVQYLSPKHVTTPDGFNATIKKLTTDKPDNYQNPYVLFLTRGADLFSKGFKPTSDLLISLVDMLGDDESKWPGKVINVNKKTDADEGVRLVFSLPKAGTKGKA